MKPQDEKQILEELKKGEEHRYSDYKCTDVKFFYIPFRKYDAKIEVIKNVGPLALDKIFFSLLEQGISSEKKIQQTLGISKYDRFIIAHLVEHLVREGYVKKEGAEYRLTEEGKGLHRGKEKQEITEQESFTCYWNYMGECFIKELKNENKKSDKSQKLRSPSQGKLCDELKNYFERTAENEQGVFFAVKGLKSSGEPIYEKCFALFYSPCEEGGETKIDIFNKEKKRNKKLSEIANEDSFWRGEVEKLL